MLHLFLQFINKKNQVLTNSSNTSPHFFNQAKHGIIVEVLTASSIRQIKASNFNKQGLNPWYERNLENIMMNMQNLFQEFFRLVIIINTDFKVFNY